MQEQLSGVICARYVLFLGSWENLWEHFNSLYNRTLDNSFICSLYNRTWNSFFNCSPYNRTWDSSLNCSPYNRTWDNSLNCSPYNRTQDNSLNCSLYNRTWDSSLNCSLYNRRRDFFLTAVHTTGHGTFLLIAEVFYTAGVTAVCSVCDRLSKTHSSIVLFPRKIENQTLSICVMLLLYDCYLFVLALLLLDSLILLQ